MYPYTNRTDEEDTLVKTVSRRDAGVEPTWMYLRRVLNNGYPFHTF